MLLQGCVNISLVLPALGYPSAVSLNTLGEERGSGVNTNNASAIVVTI